MTTQTIKGSARLLKPLFEIVAYTDSEARINVTENSISASGVDKANVEYVNWKVPINQLDYADIEPGTYGLRVGRVKSAFHNLRIGKRYDDHAKIEFVDETETKITATRVENGQSIAETESVKYLNPDTIRTAPELDNVFSKSYDVVSGSVDVKTLHPYLKRMKNGSFRGLLLRNQDGELVIESDGVNDEPYLNKRVIQTGVELGGPEVEGRYSIDYVADSVGALKSAKATDVTINLERDFPVLFEYNRTENDDVLYSGSVAIAPRIKKDNE